MQIGLALDNDATVTSDSSVVKKIRTVLLAQYCNFVECATLEETITSGMKGLHYGLVGEVAIKTSSHGLAKWRHNSYNCIFLYECSRFFDDLSNWCIISTDSSWYIVLKWLNRSEILLDASFVLRFNESLDVAATLYSLSQPNLRWINLSLKLNLLLSKHASMLKQHHWQWHYEARFHWNHSTSYP